MDRQAYDDRLVDHGWRFCCLWLFDQGAGRLADLGTGLLALSAHPQLGLAQVAGFWEWPRTKLFMGAFVSF